MFHIEMRSGTQVVRVFNRTADELRGQFLALLARDEPFNFEDHEWIPRETRIMVLEGDALAAHQLTMGRGWPNARRAGVDVTERELAGVGLRGGPPPATVPVTATASATAPATVPVTATASATAPATAADPFLRERLLGRLSVGPIQLIDAAKLAAGLHPELRPGDLLSATAATIEELLASGDVALELDGARVGDAQRRAALLGAIEHWLGDDQRLRLVA